LEDLTKLREKIDKIDEEILLCLKERMEISKLIGRIKQEKGMPIRDLQREDEKHSYFAKRAFELGLNLKAVKNIFLNIILMSIQAQEQSVKRESPASNSSRVS